MKTKYLILISVIILIGLGILVVNFEPPSPAVTIKKDITQFTKFPGKVEVDHARNQLIYLPVHSHIYGGEGSPIPLAITVSIRNTSDKYSLNVHAIKYLDTNGELLREYSEKSLSLAPMGTKEVFIREGDLEGGSGANFIISLEFNRTGPNPLVEAIMVGGRGGLGYSFLATGVIIR